MKQCSFPQLLDTVKKWRVFKAVFEHYVVSRRGGGVLQRVGSRCRQSRCRSSFLWTDFIRLQFRRCCWALKSFLAFQIVTVNSNCRIRDPEFKSRQQLLPQFIMRSAFAADYLVSRGYEDTDIRGVILRAEMELFLSMGYKNVIGRYSLLKTCFIYANGCHFLTDFNSEK